MVFNIFIALWLSAVVIYQCPGQGDAAAGTTTPTSRLHPPRELRCRGGRAEFDFGVVEEGNDYVHDFKIANKGDGARQIIKSSLPRDRTCPI